MSGERTPPTPLLDEVLLAEIYKHADAGYPFEVCGLMLGPVDGPLDEVRRCDNLQDALHADDPARFERDSRTAYNLGGKDLLFLSRSLDGARPVRVIYHSHVDVGAYFSDEDKLAAAPDGELLYPVDYLVIDAQRGGARGAKLFRFAPEARAFVEIAAYARPSE